MDAMGSDERETGGYYIVGNERLLYFTEKLRLLTFIRSYIPRKKYKAISITASTIKGSVVTTITSLPEKQPKEGIHYIFSLTLNSVKRELPNGNKVCQNLNILKLLSIYAHFKRETIGQGYQWYQNPYKRS